MADLNSKARALVQAGQSALRPKPADRERVEAALRARLGPEALPYANGISHVVSATAWKVVTGVAIGVCVVGVWTLRDLPRTPDVQARNRSPVAEAPSAISPSHAPAELPLRAAPLTAPNESAPAAVTSSKAAPGARDRLAREVALLSQATLELRASRAAAALKILGEHQRKFPNGALSEERRAAKAQALCMLGRVSEGRAELARLTPHSPAAAHAEEVCETGRSVHRLD
jgi:hypothetical protein